MHTRNKIKFFIEYLLLLLLQNLLSCMPRRWSLKAGDAIGCLLYHLGVYRKVVHKNMQHVNHWDDHTIKQMTRRLYKNMGRYTTDFLRPAYPLPPHTIDNPQILEQLLSANRGIVMVLAHLGNWELLATVFGSRLGNLHVVAKEMKNPFVNRWLHKKRTASEVTTIYSQNALRKIIEALRKNSVIAVLIDQYTRNNSTWVPFLGREAKTVRSVAGIVAKTQCAAASTAAIMQQDGSYTITITPLPTLEDMSDRDTMVTAYQTCHNDALSEQIFAHPEHWFGWFHRRFREKLDYRL